ncbi:sphingomyelin phosphodiesterase [Aeromonas cavernicola]|uniref:Endonuclease n=1 Tax=Aeromonas cavernicola TaxID=1006623 RepID=A0A2H9U1F4_9GAMM|nr:sphingomyelin phosphodiesterase [Aeromonas cavernicola]PJG57799.1 endonuclease [Aeromonas cavernicola]
MYKQISYATLLLISPVALSALADTDVYLTNNSAAPLQLEVRQTGSAQLQQGSEWVQHKKTLAPWESAVVLSINRYQGVKAGKSYQFETRVTTAGGDTYRLNQQIEGTSLSSNLLHSGDTPTASSGWKNDRTIYRVKGPQELAFSAKFTGRYDDLHYMLTPPLAQEQPQPAPHILKVASYNVWALPMVASSIGERLALLPAHLKGFDALLLQEAFDGRREGLLQALAKEYPYQTKVLDQPGANVHDGGVVIVSRYPIVREAQRVYPDCSGTDCFADKGVVYAEVIKGGKAWHLFATHTASFDTDEARKLRQTQFGQIREFAASLKIPRTDTVIYGGDFNVNKRKFADDYANMLTNLNASEPTYGGYTEATFDPRINPYAGQALSGGSNIEYLDYLVVSRDYGAARQNSNVVWIPRSSDSTLFPASNLSDHFPVKGEITR